MGTTRGMTVDDYQACCRALGRGPDDWIPVWMSVEMIATDAARAKLTAWIARTPEPWMAPAPADVLSAFYFVGSVEMAQVVAAVIAILPPPVAEFVMHRVALVGVGVGIAGFCGPHVSRESRPFFVALSACGVTGSLAYLQGLTAHELAHAWLKPEPPANMDCMGAVGWSAVIDSDIARVPEESRSMVRASRSDYARDEQEARALVRAWGFHDIAEGL
jgi:hypothetical protein